MRGSINVRKDKTEDGGRREVMVSFGGLGSGGGKVERKVCLHWKEE